MSKPLNATMRRQRMQYLRWLCELLFSLDCGLIVVAREGLRENSQFLNWLQAPLRYINRQFGEALHWRAFSHGVFDPRLFYDSWLFLALIIFICLHLLGRIACLRMLTVYLAAGIIFAIPLCSGDLSVDLRRVDGSYFLINGWHLIIARWLGWLEVAAVAGALYYLYCVRRTGAALGIVVLLMHFGFWGLVIFGEDWRDYVFQVSALLIVPFFLSLAFGVYFKLMHSGRPG